MYAKTTKENRSHEFEREQWEGVYGKIWREKTGERNDEVVLQSERQITEQQPHVLRHTRVVGASHPLKSVYNILGK